jgi:hypothetical protein
VGGVRRGRSQRALDHGSDLIVIDRARPARARFIQQAVNALLQKAPPPLADGICS